MDRKQLHHMAIGATVALALVLPLGAYAFVNSGWFNVASSHPHTRFTEWITHETMIHSVRRHAADIKAPAQFNQSQLLAGFCAYETHCVACHGGPSVARAQWVDGMEPSPPYLIDATSNWAPSQLFWIAKNGIKMTAMPAWRGSMSDAQIWNVVGFLEAMRRLPPQTYTAWRSLGMCSSVSGPWPTPATPSTRRP